MVVVGCAAIGVAAAVVVHSLCGCAPPTQPTTHPPTEPTNQPRSPKRTLINAPNRPPTQTNPKPNNSNNNNYNNFYNNNNNNDDNNNNGNNNNNNNNNKPQNQELVDVFGAGTLFSSSLLVVPQDGVSVLSEEFFVRSSGYMSQLVKAMPNTTIIGPSFFCTLPAVGR